MKRYTAETWPYEYYLKPCNLPSNKIYNLRGPESYGPIGWSKEILEQKREKAKEIEKVMDTDLNNWFSDIENNILTNGFLNPIIVHAGWVAPKEKHKLPTKDPSNLFVLFHIGGTRLYIAQKHNLEVPCLVCDFNNLVDGIDPIYDPIQAKEYFTKPPLRIDFKSQGAILSGIDKDLE